MADYSGGKGLRTYTVQESLNQHLGKVIRVSPTISASAYADTEILFNLTEIPNAVSVPGGTSRLTGVSWFLNKEGVDPVFDVLFFEKNTTALGTLNAAVDGTDTDIIQNNFIGSVELSSGDGNAVGTLRYNTWTPAATPQILLQADTGSTSVYVAGIARDTVDYDSQLQLIFHVEYR